MDTEHVARLRAMAVLSRGAAKGFTSGAAECAAEAAALTAGAEALEMLALGDGTEALPVEADSTVPGILRVRGTSAMERTPSDARHALAARFIATVRALLEK